MTESRSVILFGVATMFTTCAVCSWAGPQSNLQNKQTVTNNPAFHKALLDAASHYKTFEELDDVPRLAPALCGSFTPAYKKPVTKLSMSDDSKSHGKKLYFLYLKDRDAYLALHSVPADVFNSRISKLSSVQQVIVKESWMPKSVPGDAPFGLGYFQPKLEPDVQSSLFVMLKAAPGTPDTDDGWVYGTLTPDGKTVTSSGRVQSCMACHQSAPFDRLYGVKEAIHVAAW